MDALPTLIVADDYPENRKLFRLYLRRDYQVLEAATAEAVLELLDAQTPDAPVVAALLDLNYQGGMTGFDLIAAIRAHPTHHALPTCALTAHASPEDRRRCLEAGFDAYLSKPVLRDPMLATVAELLATKGVNA